MTKKATTKDKIPFYVFDKQIAYSPRKKGEKVVFKESFTFEGPVTIVELLTTGKGMRGCAIRLVVSAPTLYHAHQELYIEDGDVEFALKNALINNGKMIGTWQVYRAGRKILLRYTESTDNLPTE